jgi:hypothetical protein
MNFLTASTLLAMGMSSAHAQIEAQAPEDTTKQAPHQAAANDIASLKKNLIESLRADMKAHEGPDNERVYSQLIAPAEKKTP